MAKWLNRYKIISLVGQGGMGDVHLALDEVLERQVAIKRVNSKLIHHQENQTLLRYFEREAKLAASLQHPNIIQIYEYGRPVDQAAHIVSEYIDGISLEELTQEIGPIPVNATVSLLHPVAEALEFAHEQNVIHRDLKPGNVMLSRKGRVVLMDFGLAKSIEPSGEDLQSMIIGSPAFMAPEQVDQGKTDIRTDIFSFGLLAFSLATGELFFSVKPAEAFQQIMADNYPLERLEKIQNQRLRALADACIRKDPSERIQGMSHVVALLEEIIVENRIFSPGRETRHWANHWESLMPQAIDNADNEPLFGFSADLLVTQHRSQIIPPSATMTRFDEFENVYGPVDTEDTIVTPDPFEPDETPTKNPKERQKQHESWNPPIPVALFPLPPSPDTTERHQILKETLIDGDTESLVQNVIASTSFPEEITRMLAAFAAWGDSLSFSDIRQILEELGESNSFDTVGGWLAHLVTNDVLVQGENETLRFTNGLVMAACERLGKRTLSDAHVNATVLKLLLTRGDIALQKLDTETARQWLMRAESLCKKSAQISPHTLAQVQLRQANLALRGYDTTTANLLFSEVRTTAGTSQSVIPAYLGLGRLYLFQNLIRKSEEATEIGLTLCTSKKYPELLPDFYQLMGRIALRSSKPTEAITWIKNSISGAIEQNDQTKMANAQLLLANALRALGRIDNACEPLDVAASHFADIGNIRGCALAATESARIQLLRGNLETAEDDLSEAYGNAKVTGDRGILATVLLEQAELSRLKGELDLAEHQARRGLAAMEQVRDGRGIAIARSVLANIMTDFGELTLAEQLIDQSLNSFAKHPLDRLRVNVLWTKLMCIRGNYQTALQSIREAMNRASEMNIVSPYLSMIAHSILDAAGEHELALSEKNKAQGQYSRQNCEVRQTIDHGEIKQWFLDQ